MSGQKIIDGLNEAVAFAKKEQCYNALNDLEDITEPVGSKGRLMTGATIINKETAKFSAELIKKLCRENGWDI